MKHLTGGKSLFSSLLFLLLFTRISAQTFPLTYNPLRCRGPMPADFLSLSSAKVQEDKRQIAGRDLSRNERKLRGEFSINTNYSVDAMLFSGKVLYGDPLSSYVNKVAGKVLESDTGLRRKLRFYVMKSASVNAFSTNQGIIFVTVGLLSQVENEAQLACILCHEIMHYVKQHGYERYKKHKDIREGKGRFKYFDFDDRIRAMYRYSKENELEADREGMKLYLKTPYKTSEALSSFDMLLYSYLPYDEIDWRTGELEDSSYRFPASYTPSKGKAVKADEDEDDEESTHPNVRKRKETIEKILDRSGSHGDSLYMFGKAYFLCIQQQARIEIFHILLNEAKYEKAYYMSFLYRKIYNDSVFTQKIAAYCFYAKSVKNDNYRSVYSSEDDDDDEKAEGAYYYVDYFFREISRNELAVLSVRNTWKAWKNDPSDSFYKRLFIASAKNLFKNSTYTWSRFFEGEEKLKQDSGSARPADTAAIPVNLTKVEKLKLKKKLEAKESLKKGGRPEGVNYIDNAFTAMRNDVYFCSVLRQAYDSTRNKSEDEEVYTWRDKRLRKEMSEKKKYGNTADIDTMLMLNPNFSMVTYGRDINRDPVYDERQEVRLAETYHEMARLNGIHSIPINLLDKANLNTDQLNQYAMIMEWVAERVSNESEDFLMFNAQYSDSIIEKTGSANVFLSGIMYSIEKTEFNAGALIFSIVIWPTLPVYLYQQLKRTHDFRITAIVFDLKAGGMRYVNTGSFRMKYRKRDFLNSQIYALFHQLNRS